MWGFDSPNPIQQYRQMEDFFKWREQQEKDKKPKEGWISRKFTFIETFILMLVWGYVSAVPLIAYSAISLAYLKEVLTTVMK